MITCKMCDCFPCMCGSKMYISEDKYTNMMGDFLHDNGIKIYTIDNDGHIETIQKDICVRPNKGSCNF